MKTILKKKTRVEGIIPPDFMSLYKGDQSCVFIIWKNWCWEWNSNTLATWCEELTHLKRPWCWERLRAGGEGDDIGWDGWLASLTRWTLVWVNSGSWWWTGKPDVLRFMGLQRVGHDWATKLNWTGSQCKIFLYVLLIVKNIESHFSGESLILQVFIITGNMMNLKEIKRAFVIQEESCMCYKSYW